MYGASVEREEQETDGANRGEEEVAEGGGGAERCEGRGGTAGGKIPRGVKEVKEENALYAEEEAEEEGGGEDILLAEREGGHITLPLGLGVSA